MMEQKLTQAQKRVLYMQRAKQSSQAAASRVQKEQERRDAAERNRIYRGPEKVDCANSATAVYVKPRRISHLPI